MTFIFKTMVAIAASVFLLWSPTTLAGPGHGQGEATAPATGSALPRFEAVSEAFELVGVINGKQVTLYLDRFADSSPVNDAQIDIEMAGGKYTAKPQGDGEYEVMLQEPLKTDQLAVTATILAGDVTDLLAAELDVPKDTLAPRARLTWKTIALWIVAATFALLALGALLRKRTQTRRT